MSTYNYINIKKDNKVANVSLKYESTNMLFPEFMHEIIAVHKELKQDDSVFGVSLSSAISGIFCAGMDPQYLLEHTSKERCEAFAILYKLLQSVYSFPKPHVALIDGHAIAGGAFLALCSDIRYMVAHSGRYCFSETSIGLTIPHGLTQLLYYVVQHIALHKIVVQAHSFLPDEALKVGLVTALYPDATEMQIATKKWMHRILRKPLASLMSAKRNLREPAIKYMNENLESSLKEITPFLGDNFTHTLEKMIKKNRK